MDRKLSIGKAVKQLMQMYTRLDVYQNMYKTGTRTVKCYAFDNEKVNEELILNIHTLMTAFKVNKYSIVRTRGSYNGPGIIVKF
jgi:hypothetical protein